MVSHYQTLSGFVIKRRNYRDYDRLITIFTAEQGKNTYLAKGVRKISSRRAGALELFNNIKFMVYQKHDLGLITEVSLLYSYQNLANDFYKTKIAFHLSELIDRLTKEGQIYPQVYQLLEKSLSYLLNNKLSATQQDKVLLRLKLRILEMLGFGLPDKIDNQQLTTYIESIIERNLVSLGVFTD